MANEVANTNNASNKIGFTTFMTSNVVAKKVNDILGDNESGKRFISAIVSAVNTNPSLKECDNASILSAGLLGEALKLSPSPQLARYYLVPFNDKERGKVAQFQLGLTI